MLERLIESRPQKVRSGSSVGRTVGAVMFHTAVIWVGVIATSRPPDRRFIPIEIETVVPWSPSAEDRRDPSRETPPLSPLELPLAGFGTLPALTTMPAEIPRVEPNGDFDPRVYLGRGIEGLFADESSRREGARDGIFAPTGVDEPPQRLSCPPTHYPGMLRNANLEGFVTLQFVIDRVGQVERESIAVTRSSDRAFEPPARDMVRGCRFRPGRIGADSVRVLVQMEVVFTLRR